MTRTERRARLLWLTFACATLASALAGCGGGAGAGAAPTPPPPPSESAYLLAEFVAGDSNHQSVRVWDPAQPGAAIQSVPLVQSNGIIWTSSHLVFSDATTYDAATQTTTRLGHAKVFFDNDGKLYSIDLRGGQSHVPVQLSSAVDVFMPAGATPMNAAGDDAWVDAQGGSHHWAIRATMGAADAPVSVLKIVAPLRDATTGLPQYFLVALGERRPAPTRRPPPIEVADATFAPLDVAAVAGMVSTDGWVGADPAQPGLGYLRIANQLLELHWGGGAVSVDTASLHAFGNFAGPAAIADAQAVYFNDGGTLFSLANGSVHAIGTFSVVPTSMLDAGGYVAALEGTGLASTQVLDQLETLQKSSGALTLIESPSTTLQLLAASDLGLVLAGTPEQGQAFVVASGDNQSRTPIGAQYVGVVRAATARLDQPAAPVALLSCVAGTSGFCAPGALTQLELSGGSSTCSGCWRPAAPLGARRCDGRPGDGVGGPDLPVGPGRSRRRPDQRSRRLAVHARQCRQPDTGHHQPAVTGRPGARRCRASLTAPRSAPGVRAGRPVRRASRTRSRSRPIRRGGSS